MFIKRRRRDVNPIQIGGKDYWISKIVLGDDGLLVSATYPDRLRSCLPDGADAEVAAPESVILFRDP